MRTLIKTAMLAATLTLSVLAPVAPAVAETAAKKAQTAGASDVSARRYYRHERYAYRPNVPYTMYYGRPVYYAPAPFLPIPPLWGYGWEWW
jgi:response regulator of citrate/malate metabolism